MKRLSLVVLVFLLSMTMLFSKEQVRVGVIYDNEDYKEYTSKVLDDEIQRNFEGTNYDVVIENKIHVDTLDEFRSSMASLEKDNEIDAIIVMGVMVSELTLQNEGGYDKIVLAPFGISNEVKNIKNLSYIHEARDIVGDVKLMEELGEVKKVGFVVPRPYTEGYLKDQIDLIFKELSGSGYDVEAIVVEDNMDKISSQLDSIDALYLIDTAYKNTNEILELAIEKKIISFSRISTDTKEERVLMAYNNTDEVRRRLRAGVVSLIRMLDKDPQDEIVTDLGISEKTIDFNLEVAREIGVYPNLVFAQKVNFVNTNSRGGEQLGFETGINFALDENTDLKSRRENITRDEYNVKSAKADRRPNVDAFAEYQRLDKDSAKSPITPAESSVRGGVSLSYLLYDENINANVTIRDYERMATEARYNQEGLDTIQSFSNSYLTILQQNARLEVEKYNYELMKEYLQIAQTKYEVGAAGPEDIYRFQSEIADALTNIAQVEGEIGVSEAGLNRVLNRPMTSKYDLDEVNFESPAFKEITKVLDEVGFGVAPVKEFFINEGIENSPELKQLEYRVLAKERELKAAERERYMPKVSVFGEWSDDLKDDWGAGSDITQDDDRWNVGARVEIPLYKGGDIEYTKQRVRSELRSLEYDRESLETEVSKSVSSAFAEVVTGYIQTATTKESAEAAQKNLELVGDFYAQGTISISDLLDARTNSISADQVEIAARYNYLRSVINLERTTGEYFIQMDDVEKGAKLEKLEGYLK